jgi:hypothetical protein
MIARIAVRRTPVVAAGLAAVALEALVIVTPSS